MPDVDPAGDGYGMGPFVSKVKKEERDRGMRKRIKELEGEIEFLKAELELCKQVRGW